MTKLTFVLVSCSLDLRLAVKSCLKSISELFTHNDIEEVIIITRRTDIEFCKRGLEKFITPSFKRLVKVVDENDVARKGSLTGYEYQMLLKLSVAKIVKTAWYLTLDSDVYLTKRIGASALINSDDKAIYNKEPTRLHQEWWNKSNRVIRTKIPRTGLGVTPSLIRKDVSLALSEKHNLKKALRAPGTTEYTLYWLFLVANYNYLDYYQEGKVSVYNKCIWTLEGIEGSLARHIASQFKDKNTIFSLTQSNTNIDHNKIIDLVDRNISKVL